MKQIKNETNLLQIFCKYMLSLKVIPKSTRDADVKGISGPGSVNGRPWTRVGGQICCAALRYFVNVD